MSRGRNHPLTQHCKHYYDDLVAFSTYDVQGKYAIGHFEKALKSHTGLYEQMKQMMAAALRERGLWYINYEQDLRIDWLLRAKLSLYPEFYLRKYTVALT